MPGYDHHVFICYRRDGHWEAWVRRLFKPKLETFLTLFLPGPIKVYIDEEVNPGAAWQIAIRQALGDSRLMVPVLMTSFFDSYHCRDELARMLHREQFCGFRSQTNPEGLLLPVRISGVDYFPDFIKDIHQEDLSSYAIPNLAPATPTHENFDVAMRTFAKKVATAITRIPPHDSSWINLDGQPFVPRLVPKSLDQNEPPRLAAA